MSRRMDGCALECLKEAGGRQCKVLARVVLLKTVIPVDPNIVHTYIGIHACTFFSSLSFNCSASVDHDDLQCLHWLSETSVNRFLV